MAAINRRFLFFIRRKLFSPNLKNLLTKEVVHVTAQLWGQGIKNYIANLTYKHKNKNNPGPRVIKSQAQHNTEGPNNQVRGEKIALKKFAFLLKFPLLVADKNYVSNTYLKLRISVPTCGSVLVSCVILLSVRAYMSDVKKISIFCNIDKYVKRLLARWIFFLSNSCLLK